MSRKLFLSFALLVLLLSALQAKFVVNHYSDSGDPFISQEKPQNGVFNGPRNDNDPLRWYIVITDDDVSFVVYYYGTVRAERTVSALSPVYTVQAVNDKGRTESFTGRLYSDRIMLDEDEAFRSMMNSSSYIDLSFQMRNGDKLSYKFSRLDCSGFKSLYSHVYEGKPLEDYEEPLDAVDSGSQETQQYGIVPKFSLGVSGGWYLPFSESSSIRLGVSARAYPWQGEMTIFGLRADVSAYTFWEGEGYPEFDSSLALSLGFFSSGSVKLGFEFGLGAGYLKLEDGYDGLLLRAPVSFSVLLPSGLEFAVECLADLGLPSMDGWDDCVMSLCPAVSVRYGF